MKKIRIWQGVAGKFCVLLLKENGHFDMYQFNTLTEAQIYASELEGRIAND